MLPFGRAVQGLTPLPWVVSPGSGADRKRVGCQSASLPAQWLADAQAARSPDSLSFLSLASPGYLSCCRPELFLLWHMW